MCLIVIGELTIASFVRSLLLSSMMRMKLVQFIDNAGKIIIFVIYSDSASKLCLLKNTMTFR
ncbi:hypothetical protein U876_07600 [Aeromonas hydrophila NJ-35]|nr:hypothetical protein AHML_14980 [Aeromonas hydrophila ML09-119]AHX33415.1 hypothetical protein V428_15485 [Aeromonas hydrophila subsp. hydrophila AL09-71]AHX70216.1 hypothetical protein V429_15515 [Aeromonas hydrophila pc104A]AJE35772.1 hypothetical protein V469_07630 [Aeromonas hydrophila J-1]AKJ33969.1 hypothetical protein U876_07600 [Aeromonas hydrophila NJ-35]ALQ62811.1 hypothetical protein AS145_07880 [Aeromonas hydrophila]